MTIPAAAELATLIDRLASGPVLVVGDVMLDRFIYGIVERISPEAPIPILKVEAEATMLGGAGSVVRNLAALGARPRLVAVIGDDGPGREVRALLEAVLEVPPTIVVDTSRPTTVKHRYVAGAQQLLRADREAVSPLEEGPATTVLEAARAALEDAGALVLSDYGKGALTVPVLKDLIAAAQAIGCPVVVDPKGSDFTRYRGATVVTPNRRELELATGMPTDDDKAVEAAGRALIAASGVAHVLATRSEAGMTLVKGDGGTILLPAQAREVYDVSGAGDTVVAVVAAALAGGLILEQAAGLANAAAGVVVGKAGTAVAEPGDILRSLHGESLLAAEAKVADLATALADVRRWRQSGLSVGFTNGCFDLLHPGHVALLEQAAAACDRLIVGLNGDASVARLKGETRPVQGESARAAVLASLAGVDRVVVFGDDTPQRLIEAIRPDVLVKGADYSRDEVVGGDFVEGYGGKVLLAEIAPGHSTSTTIKQIRAEDRLTPPAGRRRRSRSAR